jgi:tellurite resistance protein
MADSVLEPQEVEAFARGLWMLATVDGEAHDSEQQLIREFLADTGNSVTWEQATRGDYGPSDVAITLEASFLRRVFMKAAIALVHADGVYTDKERRAIGEFAEAFGMNHIEFGELEQAAKKVDLAAAE